MQPGGPVWGRRASVASYAITDLVGLMSHDDEDVILSDTTIEVNSLRPLQVKERIVLDLVKDPVIRAAVAILLLALLGVIVVMAMHRTKTWSDTKELLDVVLPAVTALLGSAIGFYFGTKTE